MAMNGEVRIDTSVDTGGIKTGVEEIKKEFEKLSPVLSKLETSFANMAKNGNAAFSSMTKDLNALEKQVKSSTDASKDAFFEFSSESQIAMSEAFGEIKELTSSFAKNIGDIEQTFNETSSEINAGAELSVSGMQRMEDAAAGIKDSVDFVMEALQNLVYNSDIQISTDIDTTGIDTGISAIISGLGTLNPVISDLTEAIAGMGKKAIDSVPKADFMSGAAAGIKGVMEVYSKFNTMMDASKNIMELVKKTEESGILTMVKSKTSIIAKSAATAISTTAKSTESAATSGLIAVDSSLIVVNQAVGKSMKAIPFFAIIAAITAVIGVIAGLISCLNSETEEQKRLKEEAKALKEEYDSLTQSIEDSKKAHEDNVAGIEASAAVSQQLADSVYALSEQENKSAEDKARLAAMVDQLNESMPELGLAYDAQTDSLNMTAEAVNGLIAAEMKELEMQAARERAVEIMKEQQAVAQQLQETQRLMAEMEAAGADEGWFFGVGNSGEYNDLIKQQEDLIAKQGELDAALTNTTEIMVDSKAEQIKAAKEAANSMTADEKAYTDSLREANDEQAALLEERANKETEFTEQMTIAASEQGLTLDEYKEKLKETEKEEAEIAKKREETLQNYTDLATEMFNRLSDESEISVSDMAANMEHNQAVIDAWGDNILALEGKIDTGLLQSLKEAGPESAALVKSLVDANDTELATFNEAYAGAGESAVEAFNKSLGITDEAVETSAQLGIATTEALSTAVEDANVPNIGESISQGVAEGIKSTQHIAVAAAEAMAKAVTEAAQGTLDINSPSKVFASIGKSTVEGLSSGIKDNKQSALDAVNGVANGLRDTMIAAEERLQDELAAMEQAAIRRREAEEEAAYKQSIADKYQSITDEEVKAMTEKDEAIERYTEQRKKKQEKLDKAAQKDKAAIFEEMGKLYSDHIAELEQIDSDYAQFKADTLADIEQTQKDYEQEAYEESESKYREHLQAQRDALREYRENFESQLEAINSKQQSLYDKFMDASDLFKKVQIEVESASGKDDPLGIMSELDKSKEKIAAREDIELVDFDELARKTDEFKASLVELKDRGIPEEILDEIVSTNMEDGQMLVDFLNTMSDEEYDAWIAGYDRMKEANEEFAAWLTADERAKAYEDYVNNIPEEFKKIPGFLEALGIDTAEGYAKGLEEGFTGIDYAAVAESLSPIGALTGDAFKELFANAEKLSDEELSKFITGSSADVRKALDEYIENFNLDPADFKDAFNVLNILDTMDEKSLNEIDQAGTDVFELIRGLGEDFDAAMTEALSGAGIDPTDIEAVISGALPAGTSEGTGAAVSTDLAAGMEETAGLVADSATAMFDGIQSALDTAAPVIYVQYSEFLNSILALTETFSNNMQSSIHALVSGAIAMLNVLPDAQYAVPPAPAPIVIPRLARGGIVDSATIAMIGEKGREAVVPLSQNAEWMEPFREMLSEMRALREDMQNMSGQGNIYLDGREVGTVVAPHVESWQTGRGQKISANSAFRNVY